MIRIEKYPDGYFFVRSFDLPWMSPSFAFMSELEMMNDDSLRKDIASA